MIGFVFFGSLGLPVVLSMPKLLSISFVIFSYFGLSQDLIADFLDPSTWVHMDAPLAGQ